MLNVKNQNAKLNALIKIVNFKIDQNVLLFAKCQNMLRIVKLINYIIDI